MEEQAGPSRPRRSNAKRDSYAVRLDIGSAGESEEERSASPAAAGPSAKAKGKRRATSDSEDSKAESEYGQPSEEEELRAEDDLIDEEEEEDEGASEEEKNVPVREPTPSDSGRESPLPIIPPKARAALKPKATPKDAGKAAPAAKKPRTSKAAANSNANKTLLDWRAPTWQQVTGLLFQPDPGYRLPGAFDDAANFGDDSELVKLEGVNQPQQFALVRKWLTAWYGLPWPLVQELSYFPGRRKSLASPPAGETMHRMLEAADAKRYLPRSTYASERTPHQNGDVRMDEDDHDRGEDDEEDSGVLSLLSGLPTDESWTPSTEVRLERFAARRLDSIIRGKPGFMMNAGGPVTTLDWLPVSSDSLAPECEFLAIGTYNASRLLAQPPISADSNSPGLIQLWALPTQTSSGFGAETAEGSIAIPTLSLGLCVDAGEPWQLQWRPDGYDKAQGSLGHIAGIFNDGSISIFAVPTPTAVQGQAMETGGEQQLFVHTKPLLRLTLPDAAPNVFEWSSPSRIIAGCGNGYLAVWDVSQAIALGLPTVRPLIYVSTETAPIIGLTVLRVPPIDTEGQERLDEEPTTVVLSDSAGQTMSVDLRDPHALAYNFYERSNGSPVSWSPSVGSALSVDSDRCVRLAVGRPSTFSSTMRLLQLNGIVTSLDCNVYAPFFACGSTDGVCAIDNVVRHQVKQVARNYHGRAVYRLDYNRDTGQFRMFDNEVPKPVTGARGTSLTEEAPSSAWPPELAINCVRWARHLRRAQVLASGSACGLVRIDMIIEEPAFPAAEKDVEELWDTRDFP